MNRLTFVALLALVAVAGCTGGGGADIELGTAQRATVTEVVEAPATVVAKASATVTASAPGEIAVLEVTEGQVVKAGAVLLEIDSPAVQAQLEQARTVAEDAARAGGVALPRADFSRTQEATDEAAADAFGKARAAATLIPDQAARDALLAQVDQSEATYEAVSADAQAAVRSVNAGLTSVGAAVSSLLAAQRAQAEAALALAEQQAAALTVRAPIAGTVVLGAGGQQTPADLTGLLDELPADASELLGTAGSGTDSAVPTRASLEVGMPVSAGGTLLSIVDVSDLSLAAEVDETDILLVEPGADAEVELDAVPGARYPAAVESIDLAPTASSRGGVSYVVRLSLGEGSLPDGSAAPVPRPGMSAVAGLRVRTDVNAVTVPSAAVVRDGERDTVWVVVDDRARLRVVTLGAQGEDLVAVAEGLAAGDAVVVRGADQVTEGDRLP